MNIGRIVSRCPAVVQVRWNSGKKKDANVTAFSLYAKKQKSSGKELTLKAYQDKWRALPTKTREQYVKQASDSQAERKKTMQLARPKKDDIPEAYALFVSKVFPKQFTQMKEQYPVEEALRRAKKQTEKLWKETRDINPL
eukprot:TRINITY_DN43173_c0_g1_i1.p3 TRINITY_DN43173_c0_g1~~TRINITY_DN43173_c0_g1_i1.p3  ORF type:complete len:140 (+),score=56.81 TRINITY_DN43173_c0_g1_i1:430-849(+)